MGDCSAYHYRTILRGRHDPSVSIAILLYDQADTYDAVAFFHRKIDFIDNFQLIVTHREREFMDHCCSAATQVFMEHCRCAAAAIGNCEDDVAYDYEADDYDDVDDEKDDIEEDIGSDGDDGEHAEVDDGDNDGQEDQDDDDDGTSNPKAKFVTNQDLGSAIRYALAVLGMVTPSLLRPVACRNMAAMHHEQYIAVPLPDLNDVQQLLLHREGK